MTTPYHAQAPDKHEPWPLCGRADFQRDDLLRTSIFIDEFESARNGYWSTHGDNPTFGQIHFCWECSSILDLDIIVKPYN